MDTPVLPDASAVEAALGRLTLFEGLAPHEIARISRTAMLLSGNRATVILHRGEAAMGLYIVLEGKIKLGLRCGSKPEKVLAVLGAGDVFGESALFLEESSAVDAQCLADTHLLVIGRDTVFAEMEACPAFARNVARHLSLKLRDLTFDIEAQALCSGTERVIAYLLRGLGRNASSGMQRVVLGAQKGVIASQLNLTQEHFSRILHDLTAAGLIQVNGNEVLIPDVARIRICACGNARTVASHFPSWSARLSAEPHGTAASVPRHGG
jgi:CRP/FNR family transcriptional regulator, dissimilatory nitrate respiration regulator